MGDDNNGNLSTFGILFTAEKGKRFDATINDVERKMKKIPEERRLRVTGDFNNRVSPQLQKAFKDWDRTLNRKMANPFNKIFNKTKLQETEQFFSKLKLTTIKAMSNYERELDALQGGGRDYSSGEAFKVRTAINAKKAELEETKKILAEMTAARDKEIKKQKKWDILPTQKDVMAEQQNVQKQIAKINKYIEDSTTFSSPIGSKNISDKYNKVLEQSDDLSKKAIAIYKRTGDKSYYQKVLADLNKQKQAYSDQQQQIQAKLEDLRMQEIAADDKLQMSLQTFKQKPNKTNRTDVQNAQAELEKLQEKIKDLNNNRLSLEIFAKLNTDQIAQALKNWKEKDKNAIALDPAFKTEQLPNQFQARQRSTTNAQDNLSSYMQNLTNDTYIQELTERRDALLEIKASLENELKTARKNDNKKLKGQDDVKKQNDDIKVQEAAVKGVQKEIDILTSKMSKLHKQVRDTKVAMIELYRDTKGNPLQNDLESVDLSPLNKDADRLNSKFSLFIGKFRNLTFVGKIAHKVMWNIYTQIATFINPLNVFQRAWDSWINRWENLPIKNTFEVITYNLVTVVAPLLEKVALLLMKAFAMINVFTKAWFGVDLFDKAAWQSEQIKKNFSNITASFDELHGLDMNPNALNTAFDTGLWDEDDLIGNDMKKSLQDFASWAKPFVEALGDFFGWAIEHPVQAALLGLGARILVPMLLKGAGSLIASGIKKLFVGSTATQAVSHGGTILGTLLGTKLGTAFVGVASTALLIGSTVFGAKATSDLTYYWDTMGTGEKVLGGLKVAAGLAGSALGGAGLGATIGALGGPIGALGGAIIGFAVGALVDLTTWAFTSSAGILDLSDAQEQAKVATDNLNAAMYNAAQAGMQYNNCLTQLEQLEQQTGLSGEELAKQVENGTLSVENMTSAQIQVFSAYMNTKMAMEQLQEVQEQLRQASEEKVKADLEEQLSLANTSKSYGEFKQSVIDAMESGKISTEEARDYFERAMADMSDESRKTFMEDLPDNVKEGLDPNKHASAFRKFSDWISEKWKGLWDGLGNWWDSLWGNDTPNTSGRRPVVAGGGGGARSATVPSMDVGTNYVPNDGLAMIHQGEAIIPKKYNKPYVPNNGSSELYNTISAMNQEISNLRSLIQQGIPVKGEFKQRGSDLVAVVEKGKNKNGNQPLSNPAYAR